MAFDQHQSKYAESLFPSYQRQEQNTAASYMPWSHNAHDDPFGLINYVQNSNKNRKLADNADCDGETDLQGLVSNILDEADSQDSYYSDGSLPTCNPVWSPKTLREELLQYFQSESKTQLNPTFPSNYASREAVSKTQGQSVDTDVEEFCQQSNGLFDNQLWLYNLPKRDSDSYAHQPQKPPPGLPMPNTANSYLLQMQRNKYDNMPAEKDRGNSQAINNLTELSNMFRPQSDMTSPRFQPYHEDQYNQSSVKPTSNEQYGPQDINQLVSSFQSFMVGEHDGLYGGDFPNIHRQTVGMHHEDSMDEQWKITSPAVSTQSTHAMQAPKQLVGEFGTVQKEINGGVRKQTFKHDTFQDLPGFTPQSTEYFQPQKPLSASLKFPNQYQSNMSMHRESTSHFFNVSMNQYSKHHFQQGLIQSKLKPQMQREKKKMHMSGFLGEGFSTRPLPNMRGGDKKQALSQNQTFDHLGNMQSQRFDGENSMVSVGNAQQFMPFMYPVNPDPRRYSINPSNSSCRSTPPYGGSDVGDMMSASESAVFNSYVSDMLTCRGESTYHGMASAMTNSMVMNQGGPGIQLYFYLDECFEQWRCLERERKRTEVILSKTFLGKRTGAATNANIPKTLPNSTRVDHIIVNLMKEQARVASLLDRMESLCNTPLHINIHTALSRHHMAVCITQARRKEEMASMSKHQRQRGHFTDDRDILLLAVALKDLATTTRKTRTALWCALQMTLPQPVKKLDHHVNTEAAHREGLLSIHGVLF